MSDAPAGPWAFGEREGADPGLSAVGVVDELAFPGVVEGIFKGLAVVAIESVVKLARESITVQPPSYYSRNATTQKNKKIVREWSWFYCK